MRASRPVAHDDAGEIDREEAAAMHRLRRGKDHQRGRGDERRVQALRERDPVERQHHQPSANDAEERAQKPFPRELDCDMRGRRVPARDVLDQHQREEDCERIVRAGFGFQRRADARPQPQALRMHQQEYGRRIGRGDDRADQKRLGPVEIERIARDRRGDHGGQEHAGGRQHHRRREHAADIGKARAQAAVEQDQRERHGADQIGGSVIVEHDMSGSVLAREHADHQEHEQQRRAEAQRKQARQDARQHEHGA
jgi:hypothetical protein